MQIEAEYIIGNGIHVYTVDKEKLFICNIFSFNGIQVYTVANEEWMRTQINKHLYIIIMRRKLSSVPVL